MTKNERSGSTHWAWILVKIDPPPDGPGTERPQGSERKGFRGLPWVNPRKPLKLSVSYRGGAEGWIEVHARGRVVRYHGATALIDVVKDACQWHLKGR